MFERIPKTHAVWGILEKCRVMDENDTRKFHEWQHSPQPKGLFNPYSPDFRLQYNGLPEPVLRWLLCDYAERLISQFFRWTVEQTKCEKVPHNSRKLALNAIHAARAFARDASKTNQNHMLETHDQLWTVFHDWVYFAPAHFAGYLDGIEDAVHYSVCPPVRRDLEPTRDLLDTRRWIGARLHWLCQVWNACGERTFWLIQEGKSPIPWEEPSCIWE